MRWQGIFQRMQNIPGKKKKRKKKLTEKSLKGYEVSYFTFINFLFYKKFRNRLLVMHCKLNTGCTQLSKGFPLMLQTCEDVFHVGKSIGCLILYMYVCIR